MTPDVRRSVPEGIAEVFRERILSGELRPGEPLRETAIAEEFDASRNTVREALVRLVHTGVARKNAHRGCRVADPDREEIRGLMAMRRVVEPGAVRVLSGAVDPRPSHAPVVPDFGAPLALATRMESAAATGDWGDYGRLDLAFHSALVSLAGGAAMRDAFERALVPLYLALLAFDREDGTVGDRSHVAEHAELVDLCGRRDTPGALALIDRHLADAETAILG